MKKGMLKLTDDQFKMTLTPLGKRQFEVLQKKGWGQKKFLFIQQQKAEAERRRTDKNWKDT